MTDKNNARRLCGGNDTARLLEALQRGQVDAVVGKEHVLLLRLREAEEKLKVSQARYRGIVEDLDELVCRWTPGGKLTYANRAFCRFFKQDRQALADRSFQADTAAEDRPRLRDYLQSLEKTQTGGEIEYRVNVAGRRHWLHRADRPIFDPQGTLIEYQSVARDISARKKREADQQRRAAASDRQLQLQTETLHLLVDSIPVMLCFFELNGQVLQVNRAFEQTLGWSLAEIQRIDAMQACYPDPALRKRVWAHMLKADGTWRDFTVRCRNGAELPSSWANVVQSDGTRIGIGIDISRRKEAEAALRELSRQTIDALESERQAVAKELHDSIGASLAALKFALEGRVNAMPPQVELEDHGEMPFETILEHLADTIKETKRISVRLRPPTLDDFGLLKTIEMHLRQFDEFYPGIEVRPRIEVKEEDIAERLKLVIYRLVQEALNNASKHSGADLVRLDLSLKGRHLVLEIEDNGCGFELLPVLQDPVGGYGLRSMKQRAKICGGTFQISTASGEGTAIKAVFPLDST